MYASGERSCGAPSKSPITCNYNKRLVAGLANCKVPKETEELELRLKKKVSAAIATGNLTIQENLTLVLLVVKSIENV